MLVWKREDLCPTSWMIQQQFDKKEERAGSSGGRTQGLVRNTPSSTGWLPKKRERIPSLWEGERCDRLTSSWGSRKKRKEEQRDEPQRR